LRAFLATSQKLNFGDRIALEAEARGLGRRLCGVLCCEGPGSLPPLAHDKIGVQRSIGITTNPNIEGS